MRDVYGFLVSKDREEEYLAEQPKILKREEERSESWEDFILRQQQRRRQEEKEGHASTSEEEGGSSAATTTTTSEPTAADKEEIFRIAYKESRAMQGRSELSLLVEKGIPMALRRVIWPLFLDLHDLRRYDIVKTRLQEQNESGKPPPKNLVELKTVADSLPAFAEIMDRAAKPDEQQKIWIQQIEKDLPRTFPDHPALEGQGREALMRVLSGYVVFNSSVGYCQGMNFIAGMLLLFLPEEVAFKSLSQLLGCVMMGYFSSDLATLQVDQRVFDDLLKEIFPAVEKHLTALGVKSSVVTAHWFLTAFVNALQTEALLRVWDVLIFEGSIVVLMRVALAMVKSREADVLAMEDSADVLSTLSKMPVNTSPLQIDELLRDACQSYNFITEGKIKSMRSKHWGDVAREYNERKRRSTPSFSINFGRFIGSTTLSGILSRSSSLENKKNGISQSEPELSRRSSGSTEEPETPKSHTSSLDDAPLQKSVQDSQFLRNILRLEDELRKCQEKCEQTECDLELERSNSARLEQELSASHECINQLQLRNRSLEEELFALRDKANTDANMKEVINKLQSMTGDTSPSSSVSSM